MTSVSRAVRAPSDVLRSAADWALLQAAATTSMWLSALLVGLERGRGPRPADLASAKGR